MHPKAWHWMETRLAAMLVIGVVASPLGFFLLGSGIDVIACDDGIEPCEPEGNLAVAILMTWPGAVMLAAGAAGLSLAVSGIVQRSWATGLRARATDLEGEPAKQMLAIANGKPEWVKARATARASILFFLLGGGASFGIILASMYADDSIVGIGAFAIGAAVALLALAALIQGVGLYRGTQGASVQLLD